jgi:hypothetical protein
MCVFLCVCEHLLARVHAIARPCLRRCGSRFVHSILSHGGGRTAVCLATTARRAPELGDGSLGMWYTPNWPMLPLRIVLLLFATHFADNPEVRLR